MVKLSQKSRTKFRKRFLYIILQLLQWSPGRIAMATLAAQRCFQTVGVPSQRVLRPQSQRRSCFFTCFAPALAFYAFPVLPALPALILSRQRSRSARSTRSTRSAMRSGNRGRFWKTLDFRSWTTGVQDPKEPLPKGGRCPEIHESQVRHFETFYTVSLPKQCVIYIYIYKHYGI